MMRSSGMPGSALLAMLLTFGSAAATEPWAALAGAPAGGPIRLAPEALGRVTAVHIWIVATTVPPIPPALAIVQTGTPGNPPHAAFLCFNGFCSRLH